MTGSSTDLTAEQVTAVQRQVSNILSSETFSKSHRLQRFLEYVVNETIEGRSDKLGQYHIAQEVFGRDETFDPTIDAIVRVEANRLRAKLREYYVEENTDQTLVVALGKGGYAAKFTFETTVRDETTDVSRVEQTQKVEVPDRVPKLPVRATSSPTIVVLPFLSFNGEEELEYLADGINEDLTTDLSRISGLRVIARQSAFCYKGARVGVREIANELGAEFVIEGSVRKAGEQLRINVQLVDATTETHLWANRKDSRLEDIFSAQEQFSEEIASVLQLVIEPASPRPTSKAEAYDYVLLGMKEARAYTQEGVVRSSYCFQRAIELDPSYASAMARLSFNYVFQWIAGWPVSHEASVVEGLSLAKKACELDSDGALNQAALSWALIWGGHHDEALRAGRLAHSLDRNSVDALERLALVLAWTGSCDEALDLVNEAKKLNPLERYEFPTGMVHFMRSDYARATGFFESSLARNPNFLPGLLYLGACYGLQGNRHPNFDIPAQIKRVSPTYQLNDDRIVIMQDTQDRQRLVDGLRAVGFS